MLPVRLFALHGESQMAMGDKAYGNTMALNKTLLFLCQPFENLGPGYATSDHRAVYNGNSLPRAFWDN
jgi:hypothetical protein